VQLRLPWGSSRPSGTAARPARRVVVEGEAVDIEVVRHRRARRYVVRVADAGTVRLTVPRGASIAGGVRFAERQAAWIARERRRQRARAEPWRDGQRLWVRGQETALRVTAATVVCGSEAIPIAGGHADLRPAVEAHLRAQAGRELPPRCLEFARECGVQVMRVAVRNQRSRWGACSTRGVITLNWRLMQMPPSVSDYVIFHELMHLRQPNHSRRFWREVESVCPAWREAERWLRRYGRALL
jgi:hypothetical protein